MTLLARRRCVPRRGGVPPLRGRELASFERELAKVGEADGLWKVVRSRGRGAGRATGVGLALKREFRLADFATALAFVDAIGAVAQREWHHPDLELAWGRVGVTLSTHAIGGLSESDFVLAAKIESLWRRRFAARATKKARR